jgi:starch synthase
MLQEAVKRIPNQRAVYLGFALEPLMHRLLSAADLILLPSRRESCGQTQMYAQRYGAVPVARRTGGLNDTIVDPHDALERATGILFDASTAEALIDATSRALECLLQPSWSTMQRRCMALDRSWAPAALAYEEAFRG